MKFLAFVRLCVFLLLIILPIFAQSEDEIACREIIKKFYDAYQIKNQPQIKQFWKPDSKHFAAFQAETDKFFAENQNIAVKDLEFGRTYFKDDIFRVRVEITINEKVQNLTFQFIKENNQWKIWRILASEKDLALQFSGELNPDERNILLTQNTQLQNSLFCVLLLEQSLKLRNAGKFDLADKILDFVESISQKVGDNKSYGKSLVLRGSIKFKRGDYSNATKAFLTGIEFAKKIGDLSLEASGNRLLGLNIILSGNTPLGLDYYNRALEIAEKIGDKAEMAAITNNIANTNGKTTDRFVLFDKVIKLAQESNTAYLEAYAIGNKGWLYSEIGDYENAIVHMKNALEKLQKLEYDEGDLVEAFDALSQFNFKLGRYNEALVWAEKSYKKTSVLGYLIDNAPSSLYRKFEVNRKLSNFVEAEKDAKEAFKLVEEMRPRVSSDEYMNSQFFKLRSSAYQNLTLILSESNKKDEALKSSELFKSRVLYDVMRTGKSNLSKAMSATEIELRTKLKQSINEANRQLTSEQQKDYQNKNRITELENNLKQSRFALEEFQLKLYATKPELKIQRGEFQPINLDEIGKLFPDEKTAILEFAVTNERSFLYAITKENGKLSLQIYPIDLNKSDLAKKTESFRQKLQDKNLDYQTDARELYRLLLGKAEAQLKGKDSMIIVPDSFLWEVPFQALMPSENRFLIQDSVINYVPSLTVLREMNKTNSVLSKSPKLLAFGNPELNSTIKTKVEKEVRGGKLESLPSAEKEVDYLGKLYGSKNSKILKNSFATETFFKAEASKFNILHFATHGILNNQNPMYSSLVLSLANETNGTNDTKEDGLLEAWELMDSKLNADLAILSACETGRGEASSGEGIIGLSWAFFIAGTPRIVATQWKVESESTSEIMQNFHKNLRKSSNVANSLQTAMVTQLRKPTTKHPFYWAGFVSIGKQ